MRGFPKTLKTAKDYRNCKAMVDAGRLKAADLIRALKTLKERNYLNIPAKELSEDKKTVTVPYCAEAKAGVKLYTSGTAYDTTEVTHVEPEEDAAAAGTGTNGTQYAETKITISGALPDDATIVQIAKTPTVYETVGLTEEEVNEMLEDLQKGE